MKGKGEEAQYHIEKKFKLNNRHQGTRTFYATQACRRRKNFLPSSFKNIIFQFDIFLEIAPKPILFIRGLSLRETTAWDGVMHLSYGLPDYNVIRNWSASE